MQYHKLDLGRLGYQKRKHCVVLALRPAPENQELAHSAPPVVPAASKTPATTFSPSASPPSAACSLLRSYHQPTGSCLSKLPHKEQKEKRGGEAQRRVEEYVLV